MSFDSARISEYEYIRRVHVKRVVDGDTIDLDIEQGWDHIFTERCRLKDVNTPEKRGPQRELGLEYTQWVIDWLSNFEYCWIRSVDYNTGKYGRTIVELYSQCGQHCLNDDLKAKMAADDRL